MTTPEQALATGSPALAPLLVGLSLAVSGALAGRVRVGPTLLTGALRRR